MADKNRTKREILATFFEVLRSTPFEKITVKQLCEHAQISRQTFYQYFRDKYDVVEAVVGIVLQDNFQQLGKTIGWHGAYLNTFRQMEAMSDALRRIGTTGDYNSIDQMTTRSAFDDYMNRYRERYGEEPSEKLVFQMRWLAVAGTWAPYEWIQGGCTPPAERFADMFVSLIPHELREALDVD